MKYFHVVKRFQTANNLYENSPNVIFVYILLFFLVLGNFLEQVAIVNVFHYDTKIQITISIHSQQVNEDLTYHKLVEASSMKTSLYWHILGWLILAKIRTSFNAFSFSLSDNLTILTFFKAYCYPSSNHLT